MERIASTSLAGYALGFITLGWATQASAVTTAINETIETNTTNRPFFDPVLVPGFANELGYVGTANPGVSNSTTITNTIAGRGGTDENGVPLGVGVEYDVSFTVQSVNPQHVFTNGGNPGPGLNSGATQTDTNLNQVSAGEKLLFGNVQITNLVIHDPLGQLQPGASVGNALWRMLRSNLGMQTQNSATVAVSTDEAGTNVVANFAPPPGTPLINDPAPTFTPISPMYVTTTAGNWPIKAAGFQLDFNYDLAPVPASRRSFKFGDPDATYDSFLTHSIQAGDATINIAASGSATAVLDTNDRGVGVNSDEDNLTVGLPTSNTNQRFIDGSLSPAEAIQFSFDRDVSLESLTLGNLELDGSEGVVLQFVSGTNPFVGLTGYAGEYTLQPTSLTYKPTGGGQTPYAFTFGKNGQSEILIEAGTVLALTSGPVVENGFILDMLTINVAGNDANFDDDSDVDGADFSIWAAHFGSTTASDMAGDADGDGDADGTDFLQWQREYTGPAAAAAIPEPSGAALLLAACVRWSCRRRRAA